MTLRNPIWVVIGAVQPVVSLALYGPLLRRLSGGPGLGTGDSWQVLVPGLLVQLGLFTTAFAGLNIIGDQKSGVLARMQVTPVSRFALLAGRLLHTGLLVVGQCGILLLAALGFGLRAPIAGVVLSVVMVTALSVATASLSYALALKVGNEYLLSPLLNLVVVPLPLLSGVLLPLTLAPAGSFTFRGSARLATWWTQVGRRFLGITRRVNYGRVLLSAWVSPRCRWR
ncbi:MAG: ABC transporter permease [Frankia sp.]